MAPESLKDKIFVIDNDIRYVAVYHNDKLISAERPGLADTSSSESDKYEELIVNPTLLKLATQRGNIDCGGAEYVIIRYGNFYQFVMSIKDGHLSVGIELDGDLVKIIPAIQSVSREVGFL